MRRKVEIVEQVLDEYIPHPTIPLVFEDPYTLLVATLLSQSTTDARVNEITPELFAKAKTPEAMVALPLEEIETIIRPLGLAKNKSKALKALSQVLITKHEGQVPSTFEELEELPGVGHKTASCVLAHVYNIPTFPVDTHIHRSAQRWGLSSGKSVEQTEKDLKRCFPRDKWIKIHLQIVLFARKYCKATGHDPLQCPMCKSL